MFTGNLLLIEDQELYGESIVRFLEKMNGRSKINVRWEKTGKSGIAAYWEDRPDLVLLDIRLPDITGHEVLERLQQKDPQSRVLIVTSHVNMFSMWRMRHQGVVGIVGKGECNLEELRFAINESVEGRFHKTRKIRTMSKDLYSDGAAFFKIMTPREQMLMKYFGLGYSNEAVADIVKLKASTVQGHRRNVMMKLKLKSTPDLMCYALSLGFVNREEIVKARADEIHPIIK